MRKLCKELLGQPESMTNKRGRDVITSCVSIVPTFSNPLVRLISVVSMQCTEGASMLLSQSNGVGCTDILAQNQSFQLSSHNFVYIFSSIIHSWNDNSEKHILFLCLKQNHMKF